MKLKVVLHPEKEGGYSVAVPALSGCYSAGETVEESLRNVREAAEGLLAVLNDRQPFEPEDHSPDDMVKEIEL